MRQQKKLSVLNLVRSVFLLLTMVIMDELIICYCCPVYTEQQYFKKKQ